MNLAGKKVAYITLGCKLNFSETSTIRRSLEEAGALTVGEKDDAEIFVINTCSVTDVAEKKGRQLIRKLVHRNPHAYIVVVGCYAQLRAREILQIEGVSLVLGANEKFNVERYLRQMEPSGKTEIHSGDIFKLSAFYPAYSFGDRTRCFLKIQDGCDYFCTYCTIPFARGLSRSASTAQIVKEIRELSAKGVREIILTGVNTGDFGRNNGEDFLCLIRTLDSMDEIERYRISSIEPNLLTEEIIGFVAGSRHFMPHFHIPLQSGSNEVLRLMHRRYTSEAFADKIASVRKMIPAAFIGVDIIVGMRGETERCFQDSMQYIGELDISQLHVFPYSERQGTKALEIPLVVSPEEKHRRVSKMIEISSRKLRQFYHRFESQYRPVLFEDHKTGNFISGFTDNYIRIQMPYQPSMVNQIVPVKLTGERFVLEDL